MRDSIRLRLVGAGLAAVGLAVGTGLGALAGSAISPEPEAAAPPTTSSTTTSTTTPPAEFEPGTPLVLEAPLITSVGLPADTLVAVEADPETGTTTLLRLSEQGPASTVPIPYPGRFIGFGRAAAALDAAGGTLVVPHDGGGATLLETATNAAVLDTTLAWLEWPAGGPWTVWTMDLDDPDAAPEIRFTFDLPDPADSFAPGVLHVDDRGAVIVREQLWVVPADGEPWVLDGPWPQAILPDSIVVAEPPATEPGPWRLVALDRATGAESALDTPVDGDCWPLDADGTAVAWTCDGDRPFVITDDGTVHRVAADWVRLIDDGRTALWFGSGDGTDSFAVRVTHLETGETGSIRSTMRIIGVLP